MIILSEKIFGLLGFAYHRTGEEGLKNILNNKFLPGGGAMYGKGAYLTYELDSQLNSNMVSNYGEYIVKFKVNLDKVLIFDKNIQKIVFGKELSLWEQLVIFKVEKVFGSKEIIDIYENELSNVNYSSKVAFQFYDQAKSITKILSGILFTGEKDGLVLVMYNTNNMYPVSYCYSDDTKLNEKDLEWQKYLDKNLFKDYMLSVTSGTKDVLQYYDDYERLGNGFLVRINNKYGAVDSNFKEVIPLIYDSIYICDIKWGLIKVKLNNKYGLLDINFKEVLKPIYTLIDSFTKSNVKWGLIKVKLNNKYGLLDNNGKEIIKPIYDSMDIEYAYMNFIKVLLDNKWGLLNIDGKEILKPVYRYVSIISKNDIKVINYDNSEEIIKI